MTRTPVYTTRVDIVSSTVTYVGKTFAGSATGESVWQIKKLESDVEGDLVITYAGGSGAFNYAWDDRASFVYS